MLLPRTRASGCDGLAEDARPTTSVYSEVVRDADLGAALAIGCGAGLAVEVHRQQLGAVERHILGGAHRGSGGTVGFGCCCAISCHLA